MNADNTNTVVSLFHNTQVIPPPVPFSLPVPLSQPNLLTLRRDLPSAELIWQSRDGVDAYSRADRYDVLHPERDHVFEIQLMTSALEAYRKLPEMPRVLRSDRVHRNVVDLANCIENANVTSRAINRSKKGPFTKAMHDFENRDFSSMGCKGIDQYFNDAKKLNRYQGLTQGSWNRIKVEVVKSYDSLYDKLPDAIHEEPKLESFGDCFHEVFMSLRIDN
jgi:hypothetical protein